MIQALAYISVVDPTARGKGSIKLANWAVDELHPSWIFAAKYYYSGSGVFI